MKPIKQIVRNLLLFSMTVVAVSSCTDAFDENGQQPAEGTPIELSVDITTSGMTQVVTRAVGDENTINPNDVKVLVFNEADILLQAPITLEADNESKGYKPITSVTATTQKRTFLVIANASTALTSLTLTPNVTTLLQVKTLLLSPALSVKTSTVTNDGNFLYTTVAPKPIFWTSLVMDGVNWKSALTASGTIYGSPLGLARNIAKVSVRFASPSAENKLVGGTLFNVYTSSYVLQPGQPLPGEVPHSEVMYSLSEKMDESTQFCSANTAGSEITPLYSYDSDRASVLINAVYAGVPYYYRLDLLDGFKRLLPLTPNYHYIVVISKINGSGYRSAREAKENAASNNVEYKVDIDGGNDVVSNGSYYLSLDCSQYIMCQWSGKPTNVTVGKLFYKMPTYVYPGSGNIVLQTNNYINLVNPANPILPANATPQDISISLKSDMYNFQNQNVDIDFALGSLRHYLTITGAQRATSNGYEKYSLGSGFSTIALTTNPGWAFLSDATEWSGGMNLISGEVATATQVYLYLAPNATKLAREVTFTGIKNRDSKITNANAPIHVSGRGYQLGN
ncbi:MAG: hypothetical protein RR382_02075 [Tannerellaceae bacterium]